MTTIFDELVEKIVDSRLRLKSFGNGVLILEKNELMESLLIVINGRLCIKNSETGERICYYGKEDIVASGSLGLNVLSMNDEIDLSPRDLNKYFR